MQALPRVLLHLVPVGLVLALVFHFGMTLLYLTPLNPIKLHLNQAVVNYISPFFVQNWHLFAPDPVKDSRVLMVSCRLRAADGTERITEWSDISTPLREARYHNRFTPADRLDRPQSSAVHTIFQKDDTLRLLEKRPADTPEYQAMLDELRRVEQEKRERGFELLNRIASAHCDRLYGPGRTEQVRTRLAVLTFPRFSERHLPDSEGELSYVLMDWAPYQKVAPLSNATR